jgi:non-ribosomal peptide synthetase component F
LEAYENQSYQFEELVEKLNLRRDTSRNPLFDVMFNMADTVTGEDIKLDDVILKKYNSQNEVSKFDITLNVLDRDKKLEFELEYCSKLFNRDTIERLSSHYVRVLEKIVENTEIKICEIDLLSEGERNQILYEFNNTEADYPKDKTIQELFEEQVERTPNNTAVVFEDKELTYKELNEKSNQVARVLRDKGVKKDTIVGIMIERSIEMVIGIMGILKAGGAYLPIDPDYPKERTEYMLNDGNAKLLMVDNNVKYKINYEGKIININDLNICKESDENLSVINSTSDLIYVIYTSGTTGNPKGVMIEHKQIYNFIHGIVRKSILYSYKSILCF